MAMIKQIDIVFSKANQHNEKIIFQWLSEPHMQEFWDNSQEHKEDIKNFIYRRTQTYFFGTTQYWVGSVNETPFCFILTDQILKSQSDLSELHRSHLSFTGHTIALDFGIGNKDFLGKNLAAPALNEFVMFFQKKVDPLADTFFIDPNENNPRARHVYEKADFKCVGSYEIKMGAFNGRNHLLVKRLII